MVTVGSIMSLSRRSRVNIYDEELNASYGIKPKLFLVLYSACECLNLLLILISRTDRIDLRN